MNYKLLLVEDEEEIRELLHFILTKEGYQVTIAEDGVEGLQKASKLKPDLVLLDVMMPKINGWEVLRSLKNNPKTARIPVVLVTALDRVKDMEKGFGEGAHGYITKPFAPAKIRRKIADILSQSKGKRQIDTPRKEFTA